jgi:hypothetical protein
MNSFLFGIATLVAVVSASALAQDATPVPPPHAPYVSAPKPGTTWEITVQHTNVQPQGAADKKGGLPPRLPVGISSHCGKNATYIVVTWSDGSKTDGYVQGSHLIEKSPTGKIFALPTEDQAYALPVFTHGYQGTAWVDLSGYKQVEPVGKKKAYRYLGHYDVEMVGGPPLVLELDAWIDVDSGLPLRVSIGPLIYTFGPVTETNEAVVLPPDFEAYMANMNRAESAQEVMRRNAQRTN